MVKLQKGDIDIPIGTHTLLWKDIGFHNIGLLIIDKSTASALYRRRKSKIKRLHKVDRGKSY